MEVAEIDLQIREHRTVIQQLLARKRLLEYQHRKKRKAPAWDDKTPLWNLIAQEQEKRFVALMKEWRKYTLEAINPYKTHHFVFNPSYSPRPVFVALAIYLSSGGGTLRVSLMDFYRYLSAHTNLGTVNSIKTSLCRAREWL